MVKYYSKIGEFLDVEPEKIKFIGKTIKINDSYTGEPKERNSFGVINFSSEFLEGSIKFDITLEDVNEDTQCGIEFGYKNNDAVQSYYHAVLTNQPGGYALNYFNGTSWEYHIVSGSPGLLKKNYKYNIEAIIKGNTISFFVDGVKLYTYSKLRDISGGFGAIICSNSDVLIENIKISPKQPTVFAIMKFEKDFDELYEEVIVPVCDRNGYKAIRADECYASTPILQDIITEITNASIIIADITMDNPNVFYELGYSHAIGKNTILLADAEKRQKMPFDISGFRTIFYSNSIAGKREIERNLNNYIETIKGN